MREQPLSKGLKEIRRYAVFAENGLTKERSLLGTIDDPDGGWLAKVALRGKWTEPVVVDTLTVKCPLCGGLPTDCMKLEVCFYRTGG